MRVKTFLPSFYVFEHIFPYFLKLYLVHLFENSTFEAPFPYLVARGMLVREKIVRFARQNIERP